MGVTNPNLYNGMYIGNLGYEKAEQILSIRDTKVIEGLKKSIFTFPKELIVRSLNEDTSIRRICINENIDVGQYLGKLKDYQTVGTAFMYLSPKSIIGDGVGLGKTAEIAALINFLLIKKEMKKFLIAVETSALGQIQVELMRFTGLRVIALPSTAREMKKAINNIDWSTVDGIVIKHSALKSDTFSNWLASNLTPDGRGCKLFDTFFLDESSVIKNTNTKIYRYTLNICNLCRRVHFMNATIFETNIMDIYNQMDMLNPNVMPKKWRIEKEFCKYKSKSYWCTVNGKAKQNFCRELNGYKNQEEFKKRLRLYYFARCKADIGMSMGHQHVVYRVYPTEDQSIAISKGHRYMEVLNCPSMIPELDIPMDRKHVPKLDRLCELISNEFSQDRIMIYAVNIEAQKVIAEECRKMGRNPVILNGQSTDEERVNIQTSFNENEIGSYDVVITNIIKSLNLFGGDVCIFYNNDLTPSKMFQVAGRIDRNVNDNLKTFVMLIYQGTPEYTHFIKINYERAKDSKDLTIDSKTTIDFFMENIMEQDEILERRGNCDE